ncbi:glycosyltransferase family 2 protein [Rhizosphaericola mali]|uniref:Glycosyltransferase family 2 protein n=1 Tax=Rhizosphaericola mali TaxID=2545455 RepID=A0A5P2G0H7_9BACT|nr:glycosyltransferase family 2 protein [Rhizosphaericola mali]QES89314.1 glycosyltransferase family 2 protein [Rhizosphaericola mali]
MAFFSIIIPIYNAESYIEKCIRSVFNQTFNDFELILINDGSIDNTYEVIQSIVNGDSRVKIINKLNNGVSSARNDGIRLAKSNNLLFVDADDYLYENYLQIFYKALIENELTNDSNALIIQDVYKKSINGRYFNYANKQYLNFASFSEENINFLKFCPPFAKLYRKDILIKNELFFDEKSTYQEDLMFFLYYIDFVNSIFTVKSDQYRYIDSLGGLTYAPKKLDNLKSNLTNFLSIIPKISTNSNISFYSDFLLSKYDQFFLQVFSSHLKKSQRFNHIYGVLKNRSFKEFSVAYWMTLEKKTILIRLLSIGNSKILYLLLSNYYYFKQIKNKISR